MGFAISGCNSSSDEVCGEACHRYTVNSLEDLVAGHCFKESGMDSGGINLGINLCTIAGVDICSTLSSRDRGPFLSMIILCRYWKLHSGCTELVRLNKVTYVSLPTPGNAGLAHAGYR